jgi:hypothetical protein
MHAHHKIARAALRVAVGYVCIMAGSAGGDTASNLVGDEDFCGLPLATAIAPDIMRTACEFTDSKGYMMGGHCTTSLCVGSWLAKTVCESDAAVACDSTQLCHGDGGGDGDQGPPPVHIMVIHRTHVARALAEHVWHTHHHHHDPTIYLHVLHSSLSPATTSHPATTAAAAPTSISSTNRPLTHILHASHVQHPPKNGGLTLRAALGCYCADDSDWWTDGDQDGGAIRAGRCDGRTILCPFVCHGHVDFPTQLPPWGSAPARYS